MHNHLFEWNKNGNKWMERQREKKSLPATGRFTAYLQRSFRFYGERQCFWSFSIADTFGHRSNVRTPALNPSRPSLLSTLAVKLYCRCSLWSMPIPRAALARRRDTWVIKQQPKQKFEAIFDTFDTFIYWLIRQWREKRVKSTEENTLILLTLDK